MGYYRLFFHVEERNELVFFRGLTQKMVANLATYSHLENVPGRRKITVRVICPRIKL